LIFQSLVADLRDHSTPAVIVDAMSARFGGIHAPVNDANATNEPKPLVDIDGDDYDLVFDVSPRTTFFLVQAVYPTQFWGYAAAKEAIRGMSEAAALEWGRDDVNVNVICPFADSPGI
jgi:NAD(P)-dependent dehydrogenase (short-subunit alcohol dehydrogenase family)